MLSAQIRPSGIAALSLGTLLGCLAGIGWLHRGENRHVPVPLIRLIVSGVIVRTPEI